MRDRLSQQSLAVACSVLIFVAGLGSVVLTPGGAGSVSALVASVTGRLSLAQSADEILLGVRQFDADIKHSRLAFHGTALSFVKADDPDTFTAYNFSFDRTGFGAMPDTGLVQAFHAKYGVETSTRSGVVPDSCIQPRLATIATADGTSLINPTVCSINPSTPDGPSAMIGVIFPTEDNQPLADGDATCRAEIAHWRILQGFGDKDLVQCAVVDRPYNAKAYAAGSWMDVIFYQRSGTTLYNMRADSRNFQRIY